MARTFSYLNLTNYKPQALAKTKLILFFLFSNTDQALTSATGKIGIGKLQPKQEHNLLDTLSCPTRKYGLMASCSLPLEGRRVYCVRFMVQPRIKSYKMGD